MEEERKREGGRESVYSIVSDIPVAEPRADLEKDKALHSCISHHLIFIFLTCLIESRF